MTSDLLALRGARVFDGESLRDDCALLLEGGRIADLVPSRQIPAAARMRELERGLLAPGFVDLQVNGGGGALFGAAPGRESLGRLARAHRRFGTTALLPTLISPDPDELRSAADAVARERASPGADAARCLGLHVEGPFLDPARRGCHPASRLRAPRGADLDALCALDCGAVIVTLAPERVPAGAIARLSGAGIHVCAGHTSASAEQLRRARAEGLRGYTHLFNGMPPLGSREPGPVGAALLDSEAYCGLIADGIHVHPDTLRIALAARPPERMLLVTDSMASVGAPELRSFSLYGDPIEIAGDRCSAPDGSLAGSTLDMSRALRFAVEQLGLPLPRALRMSSAIPAEFLGLGRELGAFAPGRAADLVWLGDDLRVRATWVAGREAPGEAAGSGAA